VTHSSDVTGRHVLQHEQRTAGEPLRWSAALFTAAAAAIHFAVTPAHFDEDWAFGVFFAAAAWSQVLWALLVVHSNRRRLLITGAAGNLAIALVWVASRTTGVPLGPSPMTREAVAFIDVLATTLEILAAASIVLALRLRHRLISARRAAAFIAALAIVVIPVTTRAIASGAGHVQQDKGETNEQPHG
jgi:hypothetical protein